MLWDHFIFKGVLADITVFPAFLGNWESDGEPWPNTGLQKEPRLGYPGLGKGLRASLSGECAWSVRPGAP